MRYPSDALHGYKQFHTFVLVSYGSAQEVIVLQSPLGFAVCYNIFKTPKVKHSGTSSNSHLSTTPTSLQGPLHSLLFQPL